jgi:hypothetical protein
MVKLSVKRSLPIYFTLRGAGRLQPDALQLPRGRRQRRRRALRRRPGRGRRGGDRARAAPPFRTAIRCPDRDAPIGMRHMSGHGARENDGAALAQAALGHLLGRGGPGPPGALKPWLRPLSVPPQ